MTLDAEKVSFAYARTPVIDAVSLTVAPGEVVGLLGLNGAGKSTLLRLMLGVLEPSGGQVTVDAEPLARLDARARARLIATVFQSEALHFSYSVKELVALGRYARRGRFSGLTAADEQAILAALDFVDAAHLVERNAKELSGGEARRVFLARALAQESRYLLLDEPTSGFDLPHQLELAARLRRLANERKIGVLWVLHDLNLALAGCDQLCILAGGEKAFFGPTASAFSPEQLREIFHVDGERVRDQRGSDHIVFRQLQSHTAR